MNNSKLDFIDEFHLMCEDNEKKEGLIMNKENIYEDIYDPIAQRVIECTNNKIGGNPFFDRSEESMLSMLIFYFKEVEKKRTTSELLLGVNTILESINNIEDFHNLFMSIKVDSLKSVYTKSSFYSTYSKYSQNNKENEWILGEFNSSLKGLKYRFKRNDIKNMI